VTEVRKIWVSICVGVAVFGVFALCRLLDEAQAIDARIKDAYEAKVKSEYERMMREEERKSRG
jgi:hypothetical protein